MRRAFVIALLFCSPALSQDARAKVEEAKAAIAAKDNAKAAAALKAAIELDPDLTEAHDQLARAVPTDERIKLYEGWAKQFPDKAIFPAKLADASLYDDYQKARAYAERAVTIDPKCAPAYMTLSLIAEAAGDIAGRQAYLKKATDAAPDDPAWFFYYASSFENVDRTRYRDLMREVARRFPNHERGAQALYWLAANSVDPEEKIRFGEQLRNSYAPGKFNWSESGMSDLFETYTQSGPAKAVKLAEDMTAARPSDKSWEQRAAYAKALVESARLVADGQAAKAVEMLDAAKPPRLQNPSPYYLAKSAAQDSAGNVRAAYEGLLAQMGQSPTDSLKTALVREGAKLGKSPAQVSTDLWALLDAKAKPATDLGTKRFDGETKVSLADYRGKVVLLNFWYPFCGPCRGEFPYLQAILDKYAAKGFVILSPNVHPLEDQLVLPYMKGMHWGFIPVHSDSDFVEKQYGARGFPANFLLDQQGRVVYKPTVIRGAAAQRTLELQIETVLEHGAQQTPLDADHPADVIATVQPANVAPGGQGTLKLTLKLMETGHANSNVTSDPNLIPTEFAPAESKGIAWARPSYPAAQTVNEWYSRDPLSVFLSDSVITVPFTVDRGASSGTLPLSGVLTTQVCDHEQCYPPSHIRVKAQVQVGSGKPQ